MFRIRSWVPIVVIACASQDEQANDYAEASCALYDDCEVLQVMGEYLTFEECLTQESEHLMPETTCESINTSEHKECIAGIVIMTCDDLYAAEWPEACDRMCQ